MPSLAFLLSGERKVQAVLLAQLEHFYQGGAQADYTVKIILPSLDCGVGKSRGKSS